MLDPGRWILDNSKSNVARETSSGKPWGLRVYWAVCSSQSCQGRIPGASAGCCCRYVLAFGCQCTRPSLFSSPSPVQDRGYRCSAVSFAGVSTVSLTPAWGSLSNTKHCGRSLPRTLQGLQAPDLKPAWCREEVISPEDSSAVTHFLGLSLPFLL